MKMQLSEITTSLLLSLVLGLISLANLLSPGYTHAQVQSGSAFLKVLPGARNQGMGASLTGTIDELYVLYANPAATGFLREWHWSTSYTEWFADNYHASLNYARKIQTPWSKVTKFALGLQYQGVREFDSTNDLQPSVSANDLLITGSVGNPLSFFSPNFSVGMNFKYLRSQLAEFDASSWLYDFGLLYKSHRRELGNPLFKYAIFSAGVAINNIGSPLTFIDAETPLPRIFRAGTALNIGTHSGLQMQIAADLKKVRHENVALSLGTEISWNYRFALRGGYHFNSAILSKVSFGLSFKMDDRGTLFARVPGPNRALRLDMAGLEKNTVFSRAYHLSANLYPISPEAFQLSSPLAGLNNAPNDIEFNWTASTDPDLYDDINYMLLIERHERLDESIILLDSLVRACKMPKATPMALASQVKHDIFLSQKLNFTESYAGQLKYAINNLPAGEYYWAVLAYDSDDHVRFAGRKDEHVGHFRILPDLLITNFEFAPSKYITDSDYQGELSIRVFNSGTFDAEKATISVYDSLLAPAHFLATSHGHTNGMARRKLIASLEISHLKPHTDTLLTLSWNTKYPGQHNLEIIADPENSLHEFNETNNRMERAYATIPRGYFKTEPIVITQIDSLYEYELPFIPKVYFKHGSAEISHFESSLIYSPLETLAERIKTRGDIVIRLQGAADYKNGEPEVLAQIRAEAVRDRLLDLGLEPGVIEIKASPKENLAGTKSELDMDHSWVYAERRYVKIMAYGQKNKTRQDARFFYSVPVSLPKSKIFQPVHFQSALRGFVEATKITAKIYGDSLLHQSFILDYASNKDDSITWNLSEEQKKMLENASLKYFVELQDTLGRSFRTPSTELKLKTKKRNLLNKRIIVGVAEFREERPGASLHWSNVADKINERLEDEDIISVDIVGHACAIGDSLYNMKLSVARAENFFSEFQRRYPALFKKMYTRFEQIGLKGTGERESFNMVVDKNLFLETLRLHNQQEFKEITYELVSRKKESKDFPFTFTLHPEGILIQSDNETPFGRQINRRIEIRLEAGEKEASGQYIHAKR